MISPGGRVGSTTVRLALGGFESENHALHGPCSLFVLKFFKLVGDPCRTKIEMRNRRLDQISTRVHRSMFWGSQIAKRMISEGSGLEDSRDCDLEKPNPQLDSF